MTQAIQAQDLSKKFRSLTVLDGFNLEVPEGSVFGLIGSNGAGKTTTIKILMNILRASSGRAEILGVDCSKLSADDFARIGYVSENQEMPEWMTVDYFLAYCKPFYPTWDDARTKELLRQFNIPGSRKISQLSRGMRMKAALISSMAYRPRVLLLDEPFSGLDPMVREDLVEGLVECASETTILISSHDLADIESFASHIGYIESGRLQFSEEMTSLSARFREVEVTVETPAVLPSGREWPSSWIRPQSTSSFVRFVETRFEPERTSGDIRRLFGNVLQISANPMPLRSIFIALARSATAVAPGRQRGEQV